MAAELPSAFKSPQFLTIFHSCTLTINLTQENECCLRNGSPPFSCLLQPFSLANTDSLSMPSSHTPTYVFVD